MTPTVVSGPRAAAIVLDCEMGSAFTEETELLRLTAVDVFTRIVSIHKLVKPSGSAISSTASRASTGVDAATRSASLLPAFSSSS